jgi:hypothetical protein
MSLFSQTLVLYLVVGLGVAGAVYLSAATRRKAEMWLQALLAVLFWPVFLPMLLNSSERSEPADSPTQVQSAPVDEMTRAIGQVDDELEAAWASLDGWAEDALAREKGRIHELRTAWTAQAERIREMDRVLALPEHADAFVGQDSNPVSGLVGQDSNPVNAFVGQDSNPVTTISTGSESCRTTADRLRSSRVARRQNIDRLRRIRQRAHEDLMGTLAWVRELVSMIHLAKFTGAPASRAEELVGQIAAAVEGLSELTWQEETV